MYIYPRADVFLSFPTSAALRVLSRFFHWCKANAYAVAPARITMNTVSMPGVQLVLIGNIFRNSSFFMTVRRPWRKAHAFADAPARNARDVFPSWMYAPPLVRWPSMVCSKVQGVRLCRRSRAQHLERRQKHRHLPGCLALFPPRF
ncbi:hypothetical protein FRC08_014785 [Ceratobasidium sp. 394]|nr:hypothetical protein FRC08_014785 [Ceratobasidium sp. 394]KAG9097161.1 hypothetical protein FS749_006912 [Ceratobasidium sp. UAMH 11750]